MLAEKLACLRSTSPESIERDELAVPSTEYWMLGSKVAASCEFWMANTMGMMGAGA